MNPTICLKSLYEACRCSLSTHLDEYTPLIDSHCHVDLFASDYPFFSSIANSNIRRVLMINNKHRYFDWDTVFEIPYRNCAIAECFGIHPKYIPEQHELVSCVNRLEKIFEKKDFPCSGRPIVGIGETGLDETSQHDMQIQKIIFAQQVRIARDYNLPLVLHCRGKQHFHPMLDCLLSLLPSCHPIQWHCIKADSNLEVIDQFMVAFPNSVVSLNGATTIIRDQDLDKNYKKWVRNHPHLLNRLVLETDCPWLCPQGLPQKDFNPATGIFLTSKWIENVIRSHGKNATTIIRIANDNAKKLFKLSI